MKKYLTLLAVSGTLLSTTNVHAYYETWEHRSLETVTQSINLEDGSYTVQWGDTLYTIAQAIGMPLETVAQLNKIQDIHLIVAGTTLYFNANEQTLTQVSPEGDVTVVAVEEVVTPQAVEEPQTIMPTTFEEIVPPAEETMVESNLATEEMSESFVGESAFTTPIAEETVTQLDLIENVETPVVETTAIPNEDTSSPNQGTAITVEATAYSYLEAGLTNFTADGTDLTVESNVIAVDPSIIPLGSRIYIPGYGTFRAADTGGAIYGNRIDIHMTSLDAVYQFGRQTLTIYILD